MPPTDHHQEKYKDSDQRRFLKTQSGESRKCQIGLPGCRIHRDKQVKLTAAKANRFSVCLHKSERMFQLRADSLLQMSSPTSPRVCIGGM